MKYLLIGLVLGGAVGFLLGKHFSSTHSEWVNTTMTAEAAAPVTPATTADSSKWTWPDSLDAVVAAPRSHGIIYEDDTVRILSVTVAPGQIEPVHSHRWRSVAWANRSPNFTVYHYALDKENRLVRTDSFNAKLPLNVANKWGPEAPHAIRNTGKDSLILYRVEFKGHRG